MKQIRKIEYTEFKKALTSIYYYKQIYRSFNNIQNKQVSDIIDNCCELVAKYRLYENFYPELINNQRY